MENTQQSIRPHTPAGKALTDLILAVFRLHGLLLATGDRLTHPLGLSSARWQCWAPSSSLGSPFQWRTLPGRWASRVRASSGRRTSSRRRG